MSESLAELQAKMKAQGEKVRQMKKDGASRDDLKPEVDILTSLRADVEKMIESEAESNPANKINRAGLEDLCKRRFLFTPSFSIYGGVAGLYDFGPPGCALKANLEALWRRHFINHDNMLEIQCTCLTPEVVLKTSGHVEKFTDLMVKNEKNPDEYYRADKLLEEKCEALLQEPSFEGDREQLQKWIRVADSLSAEEVDKIFQELGIKQAMNLSFPYPFNLMFKTTIGPQGNLVGFLRPETAQGMFVNFRRLLEQNGGKMPFAAAQIGLGFRNEIAPRAGLLRVREFPMAEIEHFVHPDHKDHPDFHKVADLKLPLFPQHNQLTDGKLRTDLTLRQAVDIGMINNETLAYFMGRTFLFLVKAGVDGSMLRFRQHLKSEMAHYACDCWDAEALLSYGWTEIVGIADRSAYDLTAHSKASKVDLKANYKFDEPRNMEFVECKINKGKLGPAFKKEAGAVIEALNELTDKQKLEMDAAIEENGVYELKICTGARYNITKEMVKVKTVTKRVQEVPFIPSVIEPAFGVGRIIYTILEHTFRSREMEDQELRCYLSLPPVVAPTKVSVLPISSNPTQFKPAMHKITDALKEHGISYKVDDSGQAIGKRYARTDEIGIPFGITIDFQSLNDDTVTLRERDSMSQIRLPIADVADLVYKLCTDRMTWEQAAEKYPKFDAQHA
ncbi:glycyl-tRNA synthetase, putative [Perkinsus marinus ATCC 50983]|uniref:glycine--tRNA ligase n=1 Tax=Perkinsus marinus (strain ATCC 50983 / TXsc) TaxID=423536 RepID=C5LB56_PERM5|nr:glycyl-tRNA synthetase, putative [Perkinsus marinus ATCC 50983]EER05984.1 glycyl-tRNA synthetase, putative [Perkinsus marinus ATCC 50983]|eukprot:XP_002774168.1 glycyl-tRNA synthetase, putative [Perkinsus marinus ATCC 50983]